MTLTTDSVWARMGASGVVVGLLVGIGVSLLGSISPAPASADSSSAVTVSTASYDPDAANAPFPDLKVTVSQTDDLVSQGLLVNWTGGGTTRSQRPDGVSGGANFLQIAQCWGDDPASPKGFPRPDRTTCQYGGFAGSAASKRLSGVFSDEFVAPEDAQYSTASNGQFNPAITAIPFRGSAGGSIAAVFKNSKDLLSAYGVDPLTGLVQPLTGNKIPGGVTLPPGINGVDLSTNEFYTKYTTNEVPWVGSSDVGEGSVKFEVQTAMQSPGLGCGMPVTATTGKSCWLVVIPRGTADPGYTDVRLPGLFWDTWKHHVAVKLNFKPIGVRCTIGGAEQQLSGSELVAAAVASWQPNLCKGTTGSSFVLSTGNEEDALLAASLKTPSPLALTSRPLQTTKADPVQYAPIALSGLAVAFSIDRFVQSSGDVPQVEKDKNTEAFTSVNLTPRLIAKLLTNSYLDSLPKAPLTSPSLTAISLTNPRALPADPDFLAVNPDWKYQNLVSPTLGDLLVPAGRSDEANQLWRYVLSDPEAVAFLDGKADPWKMVVNPWASTNASKNPTGAGLSLPRTNFPKSDPIERPAVLPGNTGGLQEGGAINLVTWRPYTSDFDSGAYLTLRGDGLLLGDWDPSGQPPKYGKSVRSLVGTQQVLSVTTTASAAKYQTVTASLRNSAGKFVSPTSDTLLAASAAMVPTSANSQVLEYDPASAAAQAAPTAYPMTMPVYAALNPLQTDAAQRAVYANLIRYAVAGGQVPGTEIGQLPAGYASIPKSWVDQALVAATAIEQGISPTTGSPATSSVPAPVTTSPGTTTFAPSYTKPASGAAAATATVASAPVGPAATGAVAGPLVGKPTPADPVIGPVGAAVPTGLLSGLLAAGAVLLISRFRRRT